jgi:hypothetical protein
MAPTGETGPGTTETRHQKPAQVTDTAYAMDADEITYEDLLSDDDPIHPGLPATFAQLLVDGFPAMGGMSALAGIAQLSDPPPRFAAVQRGYLQLLEEQRRVIGPIRLA